MKLIHSNSLRTPTRRFLYLLRALWKSKHVWDTYFFSFSVRSPTFSDMCVACILYNLSLFPSFSLIAVCLWTFASSNFWTLYIPHKSTVCFETPNGDHTHIHTIHIRIHYYVARWNTFSKVYISSSSFIPIYFQQRYIRDDVYSVNMAWVLFFITENIQLFFKEICLEIFSKISTDLYRFMSIPTLSDVTEADFIQFEFRKPKTMGKFFHLARFFL